MVNELLVKRFSPVFAAISPTRRKMHENQRAIRLSGEFLTVFSCEFAKQY